jgi:hypothetical protein
MLNRVGQFAKVSKVTLASRMRESDPSTSRGIGGSPAPQITPARPSAFTTGAVLLWDVD